jgi:hypothetical protein
MSRSRKNHTLETAIWLDPFGILDPQVVVNLLPKFGVGVDLVGHRNWLVEIQVWPGLAYRTYRVGECALVGG